MVKSFEKTRRKAPLDKQFRSREGERNKLLPLRSRKVQVLKWLKQTFSISFYKMESWGKTGYE